MINNIFLFILLVIVITFCSTMCMYNTNNMNYGGLSKATIEKKAHHGLHTIKEHTGTIGQNLHNLPAGIKGKVGGHISTAIKEVTDHIDFDHIKEGAISSSLVSSFKRIGVDIGKHVLLFTSLLGKIFTRIIHKLGDVMLSGIRGIKKGYRYIVSIYKMIMESAHNHHLFGGKAGGSYESISGGKDPDGILGFFKDIKAKMKTRKRFTEILTFLHDKVYGMYNTLCVLWHEITSKVKEYGADCIGGGIPEDAEKYYAECDGNVLRHTPTKVGTDGSAEASGNTMIIVAGVVVQELHGKIAGDGYYKPAIETGATVVTVLISLLAAYGVVMAEIAIPQAAEIVSEGTLTPVVVAVDAFIMINFIPILCYVVAAIGAGFVQDLKYIVKCTIGCKLSQKNFSNLKCPDARHLLSGLKRTFISKLIDTFHSIIVNIFDTTIGYVIHKGIEAMGVSDDTPGVKQLSSKVQGEAHKKAAEKLPYDPAVVKHINTGLNSGMKQGKEGKLSLKDTASTVKGSIPADEESAQSTTPVCDCALAVAKALAEQKRNEHHHEHHHQE